MTSLTRYIHFACPDSNQNESHELHLEPWRMTSLESICWRWLARKLSGADVGVAQKSGVLPNHAYQKVKRGNSKSRDKTQWRHSLDISTLLAPDCNQNESVELDLESWRLTSLLSKRKLIKDRELGVILINKMSNSTLCYLCTMLWHGLYRGCTEVARHILVCPAHAGRRAGLQMRLPETRSLGVPYLYIFTDQRAK